MSLINSIILVAVMRHLFEAVYIIYHSHSPRRNGRSCGGTSTHYLTKEYLQQTMTTGRSFWNYSNRQRRANPLWQLPSDMDVTESHVSDYTNAFQDGVRQQIHLEKAPRLSSRSFSCCMSATKDKPDGNNKYIDPVFRHKQDTTVSSIDRGYIRL